MKKKYIPPSVQSTPMVEPTARKRLVHVYHRRPAPKADLTVLRDCPTCGLEREVEITLTGSVCPAEPEVGIFSQYVDGLEAKDLAGAAVKLTEREESDAASALLEASNG